MNSRVGLDIELFMRAARRHGYTCAFVLISSTGQHSQLCFLQGERRVNPNPISFMQIRL